MEDTLGVNLCLKWLEIRLNPCFSGRYSRSNNENENKFS